MSRGSSTRREVLRAGGHALAGLMLGGLRLPRVGWGGVLTHPRSRTDAVEILMRANVLGSRVWFDPVGLLVEPGQTVRWVVERHAHTATAYDPANDGSPRRIPLGAVPWDSGYLLDPGDAFETTLAVEGVYDYYCKPHEAAGMVGRIVVCDAAERSFEAPEWSPGPSDRAVPEAAIRAFPSVERILRERVVREGVDARLP